MCPNPFSRRVGLAGGWPCEGDRLDYLIALIWYYCISMSDNAMEGYLKADISFSLGHQLYRNSKRRELALHILQALLMIIFLPIDATRLTTGDRILAAEAVALGAALFSSILLAYQYRILFRKLGLLGYLQLARDTQHATAEPVDCADSEQACTSKTVLQAQSGVGIEGMQEKTIEVYAKMARHQISQICANRYPQMACYDRTDTFVGLTSMLVVVLIMANASYINPAEIAVLTVYLVSEAFARLPVIVILFFIALSPLICLGLTLYFCCCGMPQSSTLDLRPLKATPQHVIKCDGECTICLQHIEVGEEIYAGLPCSDKHVFHTGCLQKWTKVKMTCPTCRKQLPFHNGAGAEPVAAN